MPNPQGTNQFDRFAAEPAYGAVKRLTKLTQAAPMSGAPVPALGTPRRARRRAGRSAQAAPAVAAAAGAPQAPPAVPHEQYVAGVYQRILAEAGDRVSPLVRDLAMEAMNRAQTASVPRPGG